MNKLLEIVSKFKTVYDKNKKELLLCKECVKWSDPPLIGITSHSYSTRFPEDTLRLFKADLSTFDSLKEFSAYVTLVSCDELSWGEILEYLSSTKDYYEIIDSDEFLKRYLHCMKSSNEEGVILSTDLIKESVNLMEEWNDYLLVCKTKDFYFACNYLIHS